MKTKRKLWKITVVYVFFLFYKLSVNLARYSIHPDTKWVAVFTALCRKFATKAQFHLYTPMNGPISLNSVLVIREGAVHLRSSLKIVFSAQPGNVLK